MIKSSSQCILGHLKKSEEKTEQGEKPKIQLQACEECGKRVKDLRNHMQRHKPKVVAKRVPCPLCDKTFASYHSKSKHIKRIHLGVKSTCPTCNKGKKMFLARYMEIFFNHKMLFVTYLPNKQRFNKFTIFNSRRILFT